MLERAAELRYVSWLEISLDWSSGWLIASALLAAVVVALLWQGRGALLRLQRGRAAS